MNAASRDALAATELQLLQATDGAKPEEITELADQLFAVAGLLTRESGLRRALADISAEPQAREELARNLLADRLGPRALPVVVEAVRARWSGPQDLVAGLERIGRAKGASQCSSASLAREMQATMEAVPLELDLRGKRVEEIGTVVENYLNDAYLMGMPFVRIIHGKGTGALRTVVRELLRESPVVAKAEAAGATEGGEGATVAHLRQQ